MPPSKNPERYTSSVSANTLPMYPINCCAAMHGALPTDHLLMARGSNESVANLIVALDLVSSWRRVSHRPVYDIPRGYLGGGHHQRNRQ
jgi:hypothetical protein